MRKNFFKLIAASAIMIVSSCNKKAGGETKVEGNPEIVATDSVVESEKPEIETKTVEGKVVEVIPGKDGYTAQLETAEKEHYYVTVSHSNLTNHEQYKSVKVGESLKVTGDFWKMEEKNQITVRVIE